MNRINYNPDVLTCLANLSNDEVFTPPQLVNEMLDLLPQELWSNKTAKFLDPFSKTGVFLREITARLVKGLETEIPDLQTRVNHILQNQVYGIAITELTSLLSRRGLYCSKLADGKYSICDSFNNSDGNIKFSSIEHTWDNGNCIYCGASKEVYDRGKESESYAYNFIHRNKPEEEFNMKFDVIIGNPPYQLNDGGNSASASPLYHMFVQQAMKLNPRYLTMIIPARWYAGGKGLDEFRTLMLRQKHMKKLVDIADSADCFPGVNIAGGVCYFLWDSTHSGECSVLNLKNGEIISEILRPLDEFNYFVRNNLALSVIRKVLKADAVMMNETAFSRNYFNLPTTVSGSGDPTPGAIKVATSKGDIFLKKNLISDKDNVLAKYKVVITYAMSGGNKPASDGKYQVLSSLKVIAPNEACSETYLILGVFNTLEESSNLVRYMSCKFPRYLLLQALTSIHITKEKFCFVPIQDFSEKWTDDKLYTKYGLNKDEISNIESTIKPLEGAKNGK